MQTKRAEVLVRKSRVRALGVQHLEEAVDVVLAVGRPFVPVDGEKADARVGEECSAVLRAGPLRRFLRSDIPGDVVEQALQKGPQLAVAGRPIATRVGINGLI